MPDTATTIRTVALVAGGAGFLGSHLCEALLNSGLIVICLDNLSSGKKENIEHLFQQPDFFYFEQDINKGLPDFSRLFEKFGSGTKVNYVFHLAGNETHRQTSAEIATLLVNSLGTYNLLEFASKTAAKFILTSTAFQIPNPTNQKDLQGYFGEKLDDELNLQEAKHFAEALTVEYYKKQQLQAVILRLSEIFGPRMNLDNQTEMASLIDKALKNEKIILKGDGLISLQPTYVLDATLGILKAAFSRETNGKIFYLANPKKISLLGLARASENALGTKLDIELDKNSESMDYPFQRIETLTASNLLGWQPKVSITEGLKKTLEYYQVKPDFSQSLGQTVSKVETPEKQDLNRTSHQSTDKKIFKIKKSHVKGLILTSSLALVVISLISPLGSFYFNLNRAFANLNQSSKHFQNFSYEAAGRKAESADLSFARVRQELINLNWFFKMFNQGQTVRELDQYLIVGSGLSSGLKEASLAYGSLNKVYNGAGEANQKRNPEELKKALAMGESSLDLAQKELALVSLSVNRINPDNLPSFLRPISSSSLREILTLKENTETLKNIFPYLKDALGLEQTKNFFVIFTDNRVSGPIGGAVNQIALLRIYQGNKEVSFPKLNNLPSDSLSSLRTNLEKETGVKSDGIVVFDRYSLGQIASKLGIIRSGEVISPDFAKEFVNKLVAGNLEKIPQVLTDLTPLFAQKHILAQSEQGAVKHLLAQNVLGYRFPNPVDGEDYLYITRESLNSVPDPQMEFKYLVKIDSSGDFNTNLNLKFSPVPNSSGKYKGVMRIYVPKDSQLVGLESSTGEKIESSVVNFRNWGTINFPLEVGSETKSVNLNLKPPFKISLLKETPYAISIPKQPGLEVLRGEMIIDLPDQVRLSRTEPSLTSFSRPYRIFINSSQDYTFQGRISRN